jgi:cell wall-associated NlpC family hydrolase
VKKGLLKWIPVILATFTIFTANVWADEVGKGIVKENILAYKTPSTDGITASYLNAGDQIVIAEEIDNYYGITLENDEIVYIEKIYIEVEEKPEEKQPEKKVEVTAKGEEVVDYAKQFIGVPYRSGGTSLKTGVDCSGFTQQIYSNFNVSLERSSRSQYASDGKDVSKSELLPGDLVFYGVGGSVRHVAIYVGDNKIIHAPVPGKSVCIDAMWERGCDPIMGYKRIFS